MPLLPAVAAADAVPPGRQVTYTWLVPERGGPGAKDFSSMMWMYHSHVNEVDDPFAGLFGAIIITRADMANDTDATPKDVDRCVGQCQAPAGVGRAE
jgi:hephaestin